MGAGPRHLRREGLADAGWLISLFVVLCFAAVAPLSVWYPDLMSPQACVNAAHAVTCAAGATLAVYRTFRPCLLVAHVFPYCWLVVPSAYQLATQQAAWGDPGVVLQYEAGLKAQLILLVAQICLLLGYLGMGVRRKGGAEEAWVVEPAGRSRLLVSAWTMQVIALAVTPLVVRTAGGIGAMFGTRSELGQSLANGGLAGGDSVMVALLRIVPGSLSTAAAIVALWVVRHSAVGSRERQSAWFLTGLASLVILVVANPFSSSRFIALACAGSVAIAYFRPLKRAAGLAWLVLTVVSFLLIYPLADFFRSGQRGGSPEPVLASKDFDGFQQTINTVTFVAEEGLAYGHHLLSGLFFFVPRAIWADKAIPSTFPVAQGRGYIFQNLSEPFPAEVYLDLGWIGVVVLFAAIGMAWYVLDNAWVRQSRWSVVAAYVALAQVGLWRGPFGSLSPVFGYASAVLVGVVIWAGLARDDHSRSDGAEPGQAIPTAIRRGTESP